ncbi:MAG: hypothetical protein HDT39_14825 [Lachnospiraceae bacterium]|nr:hypothetical protein [Lachnospiraceae bacterium]
MYRFKQIWLTAITNFRNWRRNPRIILAFCIGFIICYMLSDKVLAFVKHHDTSLQILEPFIWTFGDAASILLISLPLLLLFADMPNLKNDVPFFLVRINRTIWMLGQILYIIMAVFIFMGFILLSTCILAGYRGYTVNLWSETAAILGYSGIGTKIAVPAFVKVLELSFPYSCTMHIFGLMLGYSIMMSGIMLFLNLCKSNGGMIGGIVFSGFGLILNPDIVAKWFSISKERMNIANILFGWISPLNHATYYMHNFGYDNLPKLWMSYIFFGVGSVLVFVLSLIRIRNYSFSFTGTQR